MMHECSIEREAMKNAGIKRIDTYRDLLNELNITIINNREAIKLLREQNEKLKEQIPKWIPCSERLPEEGQLCLVCDKESIGIDTFIGHGNPYNWKWYVRDYEAWMPLPEPYGEKGD